MKTRNLVCSDVEVRALLRDHAKTRRLFLPMVPAPLPPLAPDVAGCQWRIDDKGLWSRWSPNTLQRLVTTGEFWALDEYVAPRACPVGVIGDVVRVQETWAISEGADGSPRAKWKHQGWKLWYRADFAMREFGASEGGPAFMNPGPWQSPLNMSAWMSRLTLEVVRVHVTDVRSLTREDAIAAGADPKSPLPHLQSMWNHRWSERGFSWRENPTVWDVTVEVKHGRP